MWSRIAQVAEHGTAVPPGCRRRGEEVVHSQRGEPPTPKMYARMVQWSTLDESAR